MLPGPNVDGELLAHVVRPSSVLDSGMMNLRYGRTLPVHMEQVDLIDVGNEAVTVR
jgi:hypothetical protein